MVFEICNAFICSSFSTVLDRYQSRIIWLIPLFALIILFQILLKQYAIQNSGNKQDELSSFKNTSE